MKLHVAVKLLRLLNSRPEKALTAREVANKWARQEGTEPVLRSFQRYMDELSAEGADGPAIVDVIAENGKPRKYYLRLSQVAQWFMTEEAALQLLLTRQVLARSFGKLSPKDEQSRADMADALAQGSVKLRRLQERLRIVPDGIGRLPAKIDGNTLAAAVESVASCERLAFSYVSVKGKSSSQSCTPLGLVAKDGTIYLLAKRKQEDMPLHFALHRMTAVRVVHRPAEVPAGFDLDRYIHESHQFSHTLDSTKPPLSVRLRVAPDSLWHFSEKALSIDQSIKSAARKDGWHIVTATVPDTILLVPFLLRMVPLIEVLEPESLRRQVAQRLRSAWAHYAPAVPSK